MANHFMNTSNNRYNGSHLEIDVLIGSAVKQRLCLIFYFKINEDKLVCAIK